MNIAHTFALALEHHRAGRFAEAEALYRQILAAEPRHIDARHHLGLLASQMGRNDLAVRWIREVIAMTPDNFAAHANLGEIYRTMGEADEMMASLQRALAINPDLVPARNNLGLALLSQRRPAEAEAQFRRVIALQPGFAVAHYNLGIALARQQEFDAAIASYRRALDLKPDYADAWCNLGGALDEKGEKHEAIAAYHQALRWNASDAGAHANLGSALHDLGRYDEALAEYRAALQAQPGHQSAEYNLGHLLLLRGDYAHGLPLLRARFAALDYAPRPYSQPEWNGDPIPGQRLLLHTEQGLGDSIQFIRYAPLIAARGTEVIVECQPPLVELFRTVKGVREVVAMGEALPPFDLHVPMPGLPIAMKTSLSDMPHEVPYLFADPARRELWRQRLGAHGARLRVGLVWAGNPEKPRLRKRHFPLETLRPIWQVDGVDFFSLQLGAGTEQLRQLAESTPVIDHTAHIRDFVDTAAFITELDLVITVDTAVAHLAGALAKPVWTLLPFVPDWRWGLHSEKTQWHPTMRLFRQPKAGDWEWPIAQVAAALEQFELKWSQDS